MLVYLGEVNVFTAEVSDFDIANMFCLFTMCMNEYAFFCANPSLTHSAFKLILGLKDSRVKTDRRPS